MPFELVGQGVGTDTLEGIASQYGGQYQVGDRGQLVLDVPNSPGNILSGLVGSLVQSQPNVIQEVHLEGSKVVINFTVVNTYDPKYNPGGVVQTAVPLGNIGAGFGTLGAILSWVIPITGVALAAYLANMAWQLLKDIPAKAGKAIDEFAKNLGLPDGGALVPFAIGGVVLVAILLLLSGGEEGSAPGTGTVIVVR